MLNVSLQSVMKIAISSVVTPNELENVLVFESKLIQIIDPNLVIWLIESKYLKMNKEL